MSLMSLDIIDDNPGVLYQFQDLYYLVLKSQYMHTRDLPQVPLIVFTRIRTAQLASREGRSKFLWQRHT